MLIRQANQNSAVFVTIGIFEIKDLSFNHMYAIDAMILEGCQWNEIAIINIKSADY